MVCSFLLPSRNLYSCKVTIARSPRAVGSEKLLQLTNLKQKVTVTCGHFNDFNQDARLSIWLRCNQTSELFVASTRLLCT